MRAALETLPLEFREALVLRELEGLSYKEIAEVAEVPVGTVMSRLARARRQLQGALAEGEGMNCAESRLLLHADADGELDAANSLELERHLNTCSGCAAEKKSLHSLKATLRRVALAI